MHAIALEQLALAFHHDETTALDVGCGSGYVSGAMHNMMEKGRVVGVDVEESLIKLCREIVEKNRETVFGREECSIEFECVDAENEFEWLKGGFDAIHVGFCMEQVPDALESALSYGGRMVVPLGMPKYEQELILVKNNGGRIEMERVMTCLYSMGRKHYRTVMTSAEVEDELEKVKIEIKNWRDVYRMKNGKMPTLETMKKDENLIECLKKLENLRHFRNTLDS